MLFQTVLKSSPSTIVTLLVSASTWSQCVSYCESTGKEIQNIGLQNSLIIRNNPSITHPFAVSFKDDVTQANINYLVYDVYENVTTWAESQAGLTIQSIIKQDRELVVL